MLRRADTSEVVLPFRLDTQLMGWMIKHQKPLVVNDFLNDDRFQTGKKEDHPIRSLLAVPLISKGRMIGSLNAFNKRTEGGFGEADKRLLTIIAAQSTQIIENARLYEQEQNLRLIQEEMKLAYNIQMDLLPKEPPEVPGYDIAGKSIPAKAVGGDYFDFIPIAGDGLAVCLGDVSGKGMPAALLMANLQATLRGQTILNVAPKDCLNRSNVLLYNSTDPSKFATLFYGILDSREHIMIYSNAGHNYPFLYTGSGNPKRLAAGGIVLGALDEFAFAQERVEFDPGTVMLIFSDGITEALNTDGEEFGEERLMEILLSNTELPSAQLIDTIIAAVDAFAHGLTQSDDITLVAVRRRSE
jgi:sigma-B regulation protein RsbU (phosphoserine phosphatase)